MGKTVYRIHIVEVYDSTSIYECQPGYSLSPWGEDTDRIKGASEPLKRVLVFQEGVEHFVYTTINQVACFHIQHPDEDSPRLVFPEEILTIQGYSIDKAIAFTREEAEGDEIIENVDDLIQE